MSAETDLLSEIRDEFERLRTPPAYAPGRWCVSSLNFDPTVRASMQLPRRVALMDMTIGRGIQLPGVGFSDADQVAVARALADAGVPQINAWVLGQARHESIRALARLELPSELLCVVSVNAETEGASALAGAGGSVNDSLDLVVDLGVTSIEVPIRPVPYLRVFQGLHSPDVIRGAQRETLGDFVERTRRVVDAAKQRKLKVRISVADSAQTDVDTIVAICAAAHSEGADAVGVGDHNGMGPSALRHVVSSVKRELPEAVLAVHTHNLVGLAVADALAAVEAGAEIVDVSVNAMASTGGQADLAIMAVALEAYYGLDTGIRLQQLTDLYRFVQERSGYPVHKLSPLVGEHAYAAIGIAMEDLDPYLMNPILPETVGNRIVFSPNMCMSDAAMADKLTKLGYADAQALAPAAVAATREAIVVAKKEITDDALRAIVDAIVARNG